MTLQFIIFLFYFKRTLSDNVKRKKLFK